MPISNLTIALSQTNYTHARTSLSHAYFYIHNTNRHINMRTCKQNGRAFDYNAHILAHSYTHRNILSHLHIITLTPLTDTYHTNILTYTNTNKHTQHTDMYIHTPYTHVHAHFHLHQHRNTPIHTRTFTHIHNKTPKHPHAYPQSHHTQTLTHTRT